MFILRLILALALLPGRLFASELRLEEFREIQTASLEILARFPPNRFHYVAIGRSPTPITAYLRQIGIESSTVPISSLRYQDFPFSPEAKAQLLEHFQNFLPVPGTLEGKKLLVIDYADYGGTIERAVSLITEIYEPKNQVRGLVIASAIPERVNNSRFSLLNLEKFPILSGKFSRNGYDEHALYGSYPLHYGRVEAENIKNALIPRVEYEEFGKFLKLRIEERKNWWRKHAPCRKNFAFLQAKDR